MCYIDGHIFPGAWFGYIWKQVPHRNFAERVLPPTTSHYVLLVFASGTELLHADEIGYVYLSSVCVPSILGGFEIIEYVQQIITCGVQGIHQWSHITQLTDFFFLLKVVAETFIIFVIVLRHDPSTHRTIPLSFTYWFFLRSLLLVVDGKRTASEMPVIFGARVANMGENIWRDGHAVATRADVCDSPCTCLVACFKHVLSGHGTCKFCGHVVVPFDTVIQ